MTVSSQGEKAAPSPQARGINLLSTPRRRRQEQVPEGSGAARAGGKDSGEARRVSAREPPRKRRRNWARRAAARPRASCVRLGLLRRRGRRGPFRSPGDDKSLLAMGTRGTKRGETRARGPPRTWKPLEALQPPPPALAGSAASTHRPPPPPAEPPAGAHRQLRPHPAAPCPVRRMGSARLFLCVRGPHDVPTTLQGRSLCEGRPFPNPRAPRSPKTVGKGSERAPIETGEQRSARRGARLQSGEPRAHRGGPWGAKFKVFLRACPAAAAEC